MRTTGIGTWAGLAVTSAVIALIGNAAAAEMAQTMTWQIDNDARKALVFAPSAESRNGRAPLIFSFHGHGDHIKNFQHTALQQAWPEAIVVYFQGLPSRRDGLSGWQVEPRQDGDRDLKLVDAALASLHERFKVDDDRIYATGFSNGAMFTYLLWAERPAVFAAFAPVAGRLRPSVHLNQPRPLLHIAGTRDQAIPLADQQAAIDTAVRIDRVEGEGASCGPGCTIYGEGGPAPVMAVIHPGGHEYPNGTSDRIAAFFRAHPVAR